MPRTRGAVPIKKIQRQIGAVPATWERWDAAAAREGKTRQQWASEVLTAAAERSERKAARP